MTTLLETLTENTQDLKKEYFEMTRKFANERFDVMVERNTWTVAQWAKYLGVKTDIANKHLMDINPKMCFETFERGFYNTKKAREYDARKNEARRIVEKGRQAEIDYELNKAQLHYEGSLRKLVDRLRTKGVPETVGKQIEIIKAKVGINLEIHIKFNNITVRAWTIVASGPIQRPHYRYLVK